MIDDRIFRALADPSRRAMVERLARKPHTSTELGASFELSAPAVSQHLGVLRDAGLVEVETVGRYRVYTLAPGPLLELGAWADALEAQWSARLDALETVVGRLQAKEKRSRRGTP